MSAFDNFPSGLRHRVTAPDGVVLEVREWGDPAGPALLLVPGVAQSYLSFVKQFNDPALQHFRIISYDPRGHGMSDKPFGDHWYQEGRRWSGEVHAVIEALGLTRPALAGWSLGGRIVRQYLVDYGDARLSGLGFLSCRPVEVPAVVGRGNDIAQTLDIEDLASQIGVATAFLRNCFAIPPDHAELTFALAYNMLCPWPIRRQIGKWLTDTEVSSSALRAVRVPTYIAHGLADVLVLPEAARITKELIPHAEASWFADCGHSVFFEAPERFNTELRDFVEGAQRRIETGRSPASTG